jgi:hypothetical protein
MGEDLAVLLVRGNPHRVVQGKSVDIPVLKEIQTAQKGFFKKLFRGDRHFFEFKKSK